jgi:hypothetical protein
MIAMARKEAFMHSFTLRTPKTLHAKLVRLANEVGSTLGRLIHNLVVERLREVNPGYFGNDIEALYETRTLAKAWGFTTAWINRLGTRHNIYRLRFSKGYLYPASSVKKLQEIITKHGTR